MTVTYLELTKAALADVMADLAILESEHDGFTVLGRHYGWDIDRARAARKIALDRCNHDKRTLTIAIASIEAAHERAAVDAALADPTDPMPQDAPVPRVTLTRAAILSARTILITVTGQKKREMLEQAIADGQSSKLPIGRVLAEAEQPIDIHWCP